ncbi:trichohyalin-like [Elgaria multicarinata webbii]|uniref:trichohyalin-like n=1 Tax=Elgaria multicarinata webbii TaxID=159646 RepID=UPI002FCD0F6A
MDFQKFVAWEKLPSVVPKKDAIESSSSSSKSGSGSECESEADVETKPKVVTKIDSYPTPKVEIPPSVRNVLDKIEMTQLERAKKEVSKKLYRILDNVNRAYERYKKDDDIDPDIEKEYQISQTWEERSRRSRLLVHITDALDDSKFKSQELQIVLESFKAWNEMLKKVEFWSKVAPSDDMIDEMEECLLKSITTVEANVQRLIKIFRPLVEEKNKPRRKSVPRTGLFRAWRDKVAAVPQEGEPMTTEQMLEDEPLTLTRSEDINNMILEMVDSSLFNKAETFVIKYIATMVANITKAFSLLTRQCRGLKLKYENLTSVDNRKQDPQIVNMQRELRMALEKKAALEMQIQSVEERCKVLLITNEMMQRELHDANERAMVMSKVSFPRTSSGKHLTKSQPDSDKARSKRDELSPTKYHAGFKKLPPVKTEEEESLGEQQLAEGISSVSKKDKSVTHLTEKPQDSTIKWDMKDQEKDTLQEVVLAQVSSDKSEAELAEDKEFLENLLAQKVLEEKEQKLTDKLKAAQGAREGSKFSEWKKIQASIFMKARMRREGMSPGPSEQSTQAGTQAGGESSRKSLIVSAHDIKGSSSELKPPPLPTQVVATISVKDIDKFLGDNLAQSPSTAPDSKEKCDAESPDKSLSKVTEGTQAAAIETEDTDQVQAQKQLIDRLKETQEKEEMSLSGEMPADVPQPKQVEKAEGAVRGLWTKLQETVRERGGVIDAEAIKDVFEELDITYQDSMPGQVDGSLPVDKLDQVPTVESSSLPPSTAEQTSKGEKQSVSSAEEAPSGQDARSALQKFQTAILACLENKLEKLKKGPPGSSKRSIKLQPIDRQAQQFFQAIDKKLEECFLMKLKAPLKRQRWARKTQSMGELQEEKETTLTPLSSFEICSVGSEESLGSSLSLPGIEQEQPTTPEQSLYVKSWQEEEQEEEQMGEAQQEVQYQKGGLSQQDEVLPKLQGEEEDLGKASHPKEEEPFLLHLPDESSQQVKELWQEREKQRKEQLSEEQEEQVSKGKEPQQKETETGTKSSWKSDDEERQHWDQEQLEEEKKRLKEEQERLQQERRALHEEEEHWQQLFERQREQWEQERQQQEEQKRLWEVQLEHWHHLQQENEEQEQYWQGQRQRQKEQQGTLQEDIQRLQQEYEKHLKLQGEHAEELWHWSQLKGRHEEQQHIWQEEDKEQERKKGQWQEQLAHHEEQMEALQQEQLKQQEQYTKWQREQQERQQELERLWEKRWQEQLQTWHRQMQQQRVQQHQWQERNRKLQEKQQQMPQAEQPLAPKLKVVGGTNLDQLAKLCRVTPIPKERHISTTPELTPSHSAEYDEDDLELETTWFPKLFSKAEEGPGVATTEKRYSINVKAQRKNLELLREASERADVPSDLYSKTKEIITQALQNNVERLALLFQKYMAYCHLQEARRNLTIQLDIAKEAKDSAEIQHLYKIVEKMDAHKKNVMGNWTDKQNAVEKKRKHCFEKMITIFAELRLTTRLRLSNPFLLMVKARDRTQKETMHMPHIGSVVLKRKVYQSPLISAKKPQDFTISAVVREPSSEQIESLWKTDITELSIPLGPKVPVSLLWSEAYGFPDIPRFLELDISSVRKKPLQNIRTRIQNIPRWKLSGYNFMHL